jgi:hypothetical protein
MTRSIIHPPQIYLYIFQLFITPIFQFPHTFSINIYSSRLILRSINFLSPNHFFVSFSHYLFPYLFNHSLSLCNFMIFISLSSPLSLIPPHISFSLPFPYLLLSYINITWCCALFTKYCKRQNII